MYVELYIHAENPHNHISLMSVALLQSSVEFGIRIIPFFIVSICLDAVPATQEEDSKLAFRESTGEDIQLCTLTSCTHYTALLAHTQKSKL